LTLTVTDTSNDPVTATSAPSELTVSVSNKNDSPLIAGWGGTAIYTEEDDATELAAGLVLSDDDAAVAGGNLSQAVVEVTGYVADEDVFEFDAETVAAAAAEVAGITLDTETEDAGTLRLTLSADAAAGASPDAFADVLKTLTYKNIADAPTEADRTLTLTVTDTSNDPVTATSAPSELTVSVSNKNDSPLIAGWGGTAIYTEEDDATELAAGLVLSDDDAAVAGGNLSQAVVEVTGYVADEDVFEFDAETVGC
jgi:hypothetical protein